MFFETRLQCCHRMPIQQALSSLVAVPHQPDPHATALGVKESILGPHNEVPR
jgi:hypothetical protein